MLVDLLRTVLLIALVTMTLAFFVMACAVGHAPKRGISSERAQLRK